MLHDQFPKNNELILSLQPMFNNFQEANKELILSMDSSSSKTNMESYLERLSLNYNNLINNCQSNILSRMDTIQTATTSFQDFMNKYQNRLY